MRFALLKEGHEVAMRISLRASFLVTWFLVVAVAAPAVDLDRPPINYHTAASTDAVAALFQKVRSGQATVECDEDSGYLASLLKNLHIPLSSQVLVFSKTSLQRSRISPKTPRAIYFNDEVAVGYCLRGQVLEIAASDPDLGMVFYTADQESGKSPILTRQTENCLICHGS